MIITLLYQTVKLIWKYYPKKDKLIKLVKLHENNSGKKYDYDKRIN